MNVSYIPNNLKHQFFDYVDFFSKFSSSLVPCARTMVVSPDGSFEKPFCHIPGSFKLFRYRLF